MTKVYLTLHSHLKFTLFIRLTFLSLTLHIETLTFKITILVISYKGLLQLYSTNPTFKSTILVIFYEVLIQLYTINPTFKFTIFQEFRNDILKRIIFHLHYLILSYHITHFYFITPFTLFTFCFFNLILSYYLILLTYFILSYLSIFLLLHFFYLIICIYYYKDLLT